MKLLKRLALGGVLTTVAAAAFAFNCTDPDFSGYQKCQAGQAACNTYCSGSGLSLCLQACNSYPFPKQPCSSPG